MTATAVNGEQGRKKIAEAETGRIHRGRPRFSGRIRRKPEHVGPTPHGARASTGRVIRRGRKEAPILPNVEYEEARSNGWDFVTKKHPLERASSYSTFGRIGASFRPNVEYEEAR